MANISKFTQDQVHQMKKLWEGGLSAVKIGRMFGVWHSTVLYQLGRVKRRGKIKSIVFAKKPKTYKEILKEQSSKVFIREKSDPQRGSIVKIVHREPKNRGNIKP